MTPPARDLAWAVRRAKRMLKLYEAHPLAMINADALRLLLGAACARGLDETVVASVGGGIRSPSPGLLYEARAVEQIVANALIAERVRAARAGAGEAREP